MCDSLLEPKPCCLVEQILQVFNIGILQSLGPWCGGSNSLMPARSRSEGRTICEPSRTCTCRDVWLHYVNCIWIRHTSSARKTAIAGEDIVIAKRRKIETLMCVIHVLVTCLCLHQALAGDRELAGRHGETCSSWWGWRGLNPHVGCPTQDFKSCAYANFATSPLIFSSLRFGIIPRRRGEPQA